MVIDGYIQEKVGEVEARILLYIDGVTNRERYNQFIIPGIQFSETIYSGKFTTDVPNQITGDFADAVGLALRCMEEGDKTATGLSDVKDKSLIGSALVISKHPETEMYKVTYLLNFSSARQLLGHIAYIGRPQELTDLLDECDKSLTLC